MEKIPVDVLEGLKSATILIWLNSEFLVCWFYLMLYYCNLQIFLAFAILKSLESSHLFKLQQPFLYSKHIFLSLGLFLLWNIILMLLRTIFFTGNFKLDNNRNGTMRSAIFLLTFTIVHALGNFVDMLGGPQELNGEGYLFDRIHWTGALGMAKEKNDQFQKKTILEDVHHWKHENIVKLLKLLLQL